MSVRKKRRDEENELTALDEIGDMNDGLLREAQRSVKKVRKKLRRRDSTFGLLFGGAEQDEGENCENCDATKENRASIASPQSLTDGFVEAQNLLSVEAMVTWYGLTLFALTFTFFQEFF